MEKKATIDKARPNDAHKGLALLERIDLLKGIITSNIDGLHQAAGSINVVEFHGNFATYSCIDCHKVFGSSTLKSDTGPPVCECGGFLKPNCIFFGEAINPIVLKRVEYMIANCKVMLIAGSSLVVAPSSSIPSEAKSNGAKIIEINAEPTEITSSVTDIFIRAKASETLNQIIYLINKMIVS
jgi:NAD-dependent deacetylase